MKTLEAIRADFPILGQEVNGHPLVYLDNAATAQKPLAVIETIDALYRTCNANIHRGIHTLAEETTRRYEASREQIRAFIGAEKSSEVIFTSGSTASINLVAFSFGEAFLKAGDNLVISEMEHHANIVPWQMAALRKGAEVRVIPFDDHGRLQTELLPGLIDKRTRIVAVTQCSNVLGSCPDLSEIIRTAHAHNVPVLVDGCQGIVHGRVDVQQLDCDFYLFSGHKLYGPTGIGVLYGKEKWLDRMPPYMGGGYMIDTVRLPQGTTYQVPPFKFEAGTTPYIEAIALGTAIDYLQGFDWDEIHRHEQALLRRITEGLINNIDGATIYGTTPGKAPIVSFSVEGVHPADIAQIIDKLGVAIRSGTHCAEPALAHYGITASARLSIGLYNTAQEIDQAIAAIQRAVHMLR